MGFGGFGGIPRKPGGHHEPVLGPIQGIQPGASQQKHKPNLGAIQSNQPSKILNKPATLGPTQKWSPPKQEQVRVDDPLAYTLGAVTDYHVVILSKISQNLKTCLASLFRCEPGLPQHRVIVVDDGAGAGCQPYFPAVRYIKGVLPFVFARNANIGIQAAQSDVVLLNDDAFLMTQGGLSQMSSVMSGSPTIGLCSGAIFNGMEAGNVNQSSSAAGFLRRERKVLPFVCVYIPKRTQEAIGLLDEQFTGYGYDDNDYCRRVMALRYSMGILSGCVVDHGKKERSTFRVQGNFAALFAENKKRFEQKWGGQAAYVAIAPPAAVRPAPVSAPALVPATPAPAAAPAPPAAFTPGLPSEAVKVSCILTSYNRPVLVRQALKSLQDQTHKNFEVLIFDDSSQMEIEPIVREFGLPVSQIFQSQVTPLQRRSVNRLSVNINKGLAAATGDLVCFLADDDYYFPGWFEAAAKFFQARPGIHVGYGKLVYSKSLGMEFNLKNETRWPGKVLAKPYELVDHNQVIHRRFAVPYTWPEDFKTVSNPDAHYFRAVSAHYPFHPIPAYAAVKRMHKKNLQSTVNDVIGERAENLRE